MAVDLRQIAKQYSAKATGKESNPAVPRMESVRMDVGLRLRLLLVASGVSARSYLKFMKSLVE